MVAEDEADETGAATAVEVKRVATVAKAVTAERVAEGGRKVAAAAMGKVAAALLAQEEVRARNRRSIRDRRSAEMADSCSQRRL